MAENKSKSQAQKAAAKKQTGKSGGKNSANKNKKTNQQQEQLVIPVRLLTSVICLGLFVLFLVIFLWPEGVVVEKILLPFIQGLIGKAAFYVAIPALLYLFVIQAFSGKRPIILRSVCMISFVLICGCISQLTFDCCRSFRV